MANDEHVNRLLESRELFRIWRSDNYQIHPDLSNADLSGQDLKWAHLRGADLSGANLQRTNLASCDLTAANLQGASLRDCSLHDARLRSTRLEDADLTGASLYATDLLDLNLFNTRGLLEAKVLGPCHVDVHTIYKSGELLPQSFLRACGVPDSLLMTLPNIVHRPERHYSCFISFAEEDRKFVEKLNKDLKRRNICSWVWNENASWGGLLRNSIGQAIMEYDRLIVVLSKHSLNSEPVQREIRRALQKEEQLSNARNPNYQVLFPIRIDEHVFTSSNALVPDIKESHIADFTNWSNNRVYASAIKRLEADLVKEVLITNQARWYPIFQTTELELAENS